MPFWKFGGGYSYRTPGSKKTRWSKTLSGVPKTARTSTKKEKSKKSSPKESKRRRKPMPKKKKTKKAGFRLPGGLGPKGILTGILGMSVIPRLLPITSPGAAKLATGLALRALKLGGGGPLAAVGIMELAAEFAAPFLGTFVGGIMPGNSGNARGVYDY